MTAPLVALTASTRRMEGIVRVRLNEDYVDAVRDAGLIPLILPPRDPKELDTVLPIVRGVVLTGGEDVDPAEYGAEASPKTYPPHPQRDAFELALVRAAHARRLPTLAICRGIQVVNVALGGTLVQDIPSECPSAINHEQADGDEREMRVHDVTLERGSQLAEAVGSTAIAVNSAHHQALARVAPGLRVTARAPDGIIEGAEWRDDDWWMLGVQWHPEELVRDGKPWDRGLFQAFAERVVRDQRSGRWGAKVLAWLDYLRPS